MGYSTYHTRVYTADGTPVASISTTTLQHSDSALRPVVYAVAADVFGNRMTIDCIVMNDDGSYNVEKEAEDGM